VASRAAAAVAAAVFAASTLLSPVAVLPTAAHGSMEHNMSATGAPGTMASRCAPDGTMTFTCVVFSGG
jgi:hypothetical protein